MQTFSLLCFSSSNRVGGVAHDCVKTASKSLFPDYKLPFDLDREYLENGLGFPFSAQINLGGSFDCSILCHVHLFNSGLLSHGGTFFNLNRLLIFPSLSDYFPPGELIRTLASEK